MANHKSALKRARQNEKRNKRNRMLRSILRGTIKNFRQKLATDPSAAEKDLGRLYKVIDKSVTKGIIHTNKARRHKSRLTIALRKVAS